MHILICTLCLACILSYIVHTMHPAMRIVLTFIYSHIPIDLHPHLASGWPRISGSGKPTHRQWSRQQRTRMQTPFSRWRDRLVFRKTMGFSTIKTIFEEIRWDKCWSSDSFQAAHEKDSTYSTFRISGPAQLGIRWVQLVLSSKEVGILLIERRESWWKLRFQALNLGI